MSLLNNNPIQTQAWKKLSAHFEEMHSFSIKKAFEENTNRKQDFSIQTNDLLVDYSKNRIDQKTMSLLVDLAKELHLTDAIEKYFSGDKINVTEDRAVLHTALRNNSEESLKIIPAIMKLKNKGFNITGPLVADTVFVNLYKKYDVLIGMYHDQVLAPFKAIFHFKAINVTLGLNYIRVSPDHGPALNLLGKNKANYISLMECIKFINRLK